MAVTTAIVDIVPPSPAPALLPSNKSSMNKRWPPLADKTSLPYRLTTLSKQKLAREATAPDPDIRRCLGHFRLHCRSMEWAQHDMTTKINSFELEDDESESESEDDEPRPIRRQDALTAETPTENEIPAESTPEPQQAQAIRIHFEVSPPPSSEESEEKDGLLEKGRSCLEKTVQRKSFWPSAGQCMPVRITG
ncbi:hypothetical protein P175DRAFT_0473708 [Aspergillus ochraceoroseus IBT 24754]|uniref:Uncharacterized protein n=1 Tax=Aspergillus ochraceoroseus IBT 24754 TaxID=1392256 RepID=A0A2T5M1Z3_9EURO|nr:uncharacterized protein P175DRAFT_0473708 [Aspergillus ochraceoroseus IBT 24754]PTU22553.1 hypothetical protein P175DRAFT_0473708 [Aspergillus ochraceoroseus IBT 24754]